MLKFYTKRELEEIKTTAAKAAVEEYKKSITPVPYTEVDQLRENCSVMLEMDNANFNIFSIERVLMGEQKEHTVVGYVFTENGAPSVKQWYMHISRSQHNKLVQKYSERPPAVQKEVKKK